MHISAKKTDQLTETKILRDLAIVIANLHTPAEAALFIEDFLSPSERTTLAKRLAVLIGLEKKCSYQTLLDSLHVSSATISLARTQQNRKGVQLALSKLIEDEWATKLALKIQKVFGRK